jgi:mannitol-1-/sugar-/sorbitol-6-phosphatase
MRILPGTVLTARALVFDMDGTLIDSTALLSTLWRKWAERHGADPEAVVRAQVGRRAIEIVRMFAPADVDAAAEVSRLFAAAEEDTDGLRVVPGATELLRSLPRDRWAVVTSAGRDLAARWFRGTGLPLPELLVAAGDVSRGKPDPEGYLLAARQLGCRPQEMIVFEDSPAGLSAATAARARAVAVHIAGGAAATDRHDWIADYTRMSYHADADRLSF